MSEAQYERLKKYFLEEQLLKCQNGSIVSISTEEGGHVLSFQYISGVFTSEMHTRFNLNPKPGWATFILCLGRRYNLLATRTDLDAIVELCARLGIDLMEFMAMDFFTIEKPNQTTESP